MHLIEVDLESIRNHRNGIAQLVGVYYLAADTATTAALNEVDMEQIRNYRVGVSNLYAEWDAASHVYSRDYTERFANLPGTVTP